MNTPPLTRLKINEAPPTRQNVDSSLRGLVAIRSDHRRLSECAEEVGHGTDGDGTGQIQSGGVFVRTGRFLPIGTRTLISCNIVIERRRRVLVSERSLVVIFFFITRL